MSGRPCEIGWQIAANRRIRIGCVRPHVRLQLFAIHPFGPRFSNHYCTARITIRSGPEEKVKSFAGLIVYLFGIKSSFPAGTNETSRIMKTFLTLCLTLIALSAFAQQRPAAPPPPPPPPNAPATAAPINPAGQPNAAAPGQPGAPIPPPGAPGMSPATAPGLSPAAGMSPAAAPGISPAAGTSPMPGTTVTTTLSPAPAASPVATASPPVETGGVLSSNWLIDKFRKGGPIMWPILIVSIIALTVVIERIIWWSGRWFRRDPKRIEKVFTAIEVNDVAEASRLSRDSRDPVLRMMWNGLNHQHASLQGALQVAAGIEIKRAGRFLVVMDTLVTLAPLLGLLGTITGLIRSFSFLGNEELAVQAVTGGIAEALIATACGLGIAIFALVPFNFFTSRVSNLEFELQTAATNLEVMLEAQSKAREGVEIERATPASATRSSI
jgi:biopolymer transport protein ExbB